MQHGDRPELMWGLALPENAARIIKATSGEDFLLHNWSFDDIPAEAPKAETPTLVWIPASVWNTLNDEKRSFYDAWEETQRVLLLDGDQKDVDFATLVEEGFLTAVCTPLTTGKVQDVLYRATEINSLYADIFRMTREIFLERELLARKTDQLLFLNQILSRAAESLDPGTILVRAREDMNMLFPVNSLQAVFWTPNDAESIDAEILLSPGVDKKSHDAWIKYFLDNAEKLSASAVKSYKVDLLREGEAPAAPAPDTRDKVLMPLRAGYEYFGCLALTSPGKSRIAKDQIQTMRAAVNHLALALKNALLYSQVKTMADYDGLTRIRNRHSFDRRFVEEIKRHQRYGHTLSLLLLDLDHFKQINDDYGHLAGDTVLKEVGRILTNSVRATDFPARYGGEEFVIILPQTSEEQARMLAERIRKVIESHRFQHGSKSFSVTASFGVATLHPGSLQKEEELVQEADRALYLAKTKGRNMVCMSCPPNEPHAVSQ